MSVIVATLKHSRINTVQKFAPINPTFVKKKVVKRSFYLEQSFNKSSKILIIVKGKR